MRGSELANPFVVMQDSDLNRLNRLNQLNNKTVDLQKEEFNKQAENGLQSRSSENGKTSVWHYGLKLQWYLTRDMEI